MSQHSGKEEKKYIYDWYLYVDVYERFCLSVENVLGLIHI